MTQIFGNFLQELPEEEEYLTLFFLPRYFHVKFWETNKLSAEILADYFKKFINTQRDTVANDLEPIEINNTIYAVKYIANELLENAMKFQDKTSQVAAYLKLSLYSDKVIFHVTNSINVEQVETFQAFIQKLISSDPIELYMNTTIANVKEEHNKARSNLGLLSMICFYSAKLGWKFETLQMDLPVITVSTMVCLNIKDIQNDECPSMSYKFELASA